MNPFHYHPINLSSVGGELKVRPKYTHTTRNLPIHLKMNYTPTLTSRLIQEEISNIGSKIKQTNKQIKTPIIFSGQLLS